MISNTKEKVEAIDGLILDLISKINELEHELRFQPHMKTQIDIMREDVQRLFKQSQSFFVVPMRKGWIY